MKLWYVAHPYSGAELTNFKLAVLRTNRILDKGYLVFSPIVHSHPLDMDQKRKPDFWYGQDLKIITKCDGIILCPEWQLSAGCIMELSIAKDLDLEIRYYNEIIKDVLVI